MGRVRTGWRLARVSWSVLRKDGSLAVYPAVASVVALVAFWIVAGVGIVVENAVATPWVALPFLLAGVYVAIYFVVYFSVALAAAAQQSIDGRDTGLRDGLKVARTRRGVVAKWALLELALGLVMSVIGALLNDAGAKTLSNLVSAAAGFAWSVATFFVIPVVALEGLGPRDAMTRSVALIRTHWGEAVVGRTGIGAVVFLIALLPIAGLSVLGTTLAPASPALAGAADALVAIVAILAIVLGSALSVIFRVEAYRWATTGELAGAFSSGDVLAVFRSTRSQRRQAVPSSDEQ